MIRINLLPTSGQQEQLSLNYIFGIGFGVVFFVLILFYGYGCYQEYAVNSKLNHLRAERQSLEYFEQMQNLAKEKQAAISKKTNLVKNLGKERKAWTSIITSLSNITPKEVWFDEMAMLEENTLKLAGHAVAYNDLARFLKVL